MADAAEIVSPVDWIGSVARLLHLIHNDTVVRRDATRTLLNLRFLMEGAEPCPARSARNGALRNSYLCAVDGIIKIELGRILILVFGGIACPKNPFLQKSRHAKRMAPQMTCG